MNPQAGQRHTACIRYMAAPQRSHSVFSSVGGATFTGEIGRAGGRCGVWSDMASDYRIQTGFGLVRGRVSHYNETRELMKQTVELSPNVSITDES